MYIIVKVKYRTNNVKLKSETDYLLLPTFRLYSGAIANINVYDIYPKPCNYDGIVTKTTKFKKVGLN